MHPHLPLPHGTQLTTLAPPYSMQTPYARINQYNFFFHYFYGLIQELISCVYVFSYLRLESLQQWSITTPFQPIEVNSFEYIPTFDQCSA